MVEYELGDIIVTKDGNGVFSKAIQWFTQSKYDHAGVICDRFEDGRIGVFEAQSEGFVHNTYDREWLESNSDVYRLKRGLSIDERSELVVRMQDYVGTPYGYSTLFWIALDIVTVGSVGYSDGLKTLICSEAVSRLYQDVLGVDLVEGKPHDMVEPADIALSPLLEKVG